MKINDLTQQAIEYNRKVIDNYFKSIVALQERTEGFVEQTIEKAELIPEEGRKILRGLLKLNKEYRESARSPGS